MNNLRLMEVLLAPHISEKATVLADTRKQFVFRVRMDANKLEIKQAVEKLFNVQVNSVSTVISKGKSKNFGRMRGQRSDWKKAYVGLKEGFDIKFASE
jgi:large subunit ribosomal protein L23